MNTVKKYLIIVLICLAGISVAAQQNSTVNDIALSIWIPDNIDGLTVAAKQNLHNKLAQIASKNGIYAAPIASPCVLTANVIVLDKHITPDIPAKYFYELEITFYIGNAIEGKSFASYSVKVKGAGNNDTKAYMNALQNIKTDNPAYQSFLEQGKLRMVEYFNNQCDIIIKEAEMFVATQQYQKALYVLSTIPNGCTACWERALNVRNELFYKKINTECQPLLLLATNIWNGGQDYNAAMKASYILSGINPSSQCFGDAQTLVEKIGERMKELDQREWNYMNKKLDAKISLQKELINAYRDVAVAWAENQPQTYIISESYRIFW